LNNQEARILIKEKIPFEETTTTEKNTSSSVSFKDVSITLTVTPKISPDNYVTLKVRPEISQQNSLTTKGEPIIGTTEADTNVIIKNGETLVIGGLIKNNNVRTVSSIPVLGDIPFLRNAFRSVRVVSKKTETIVLITPHVIEDVIRNTTMHMEKYNVIGEQEAFNG
jgi:type II secretory pathway component GspD/PulD (secretin)